MVKVSNKAIAAGKIEANVRGAIPAASALPLTMSSVDHPSLNLSVSSSQRRLRERCFDSLDRFLSVLQAVERTQAEVTFTGGTESAARRTNDV